MSWRVVAIGSRLLVLIIILIRVALGNDEAIHSAAIRHRYHLPVNDLTLKLHLLCLLMDDPVFERW